MPGQVARPAETPLPNLGEDVLADLGTTARDLRASGHPLGFTSFVHLRADGAADERRLGDKAEYRSYGVGMAATSVPEDPDEQRVADELIGLDPDDPETQAFAAHLHRQHNVRSGYTVEGYLSDVSDFADSANRLGGHRKLMAGILAVLILLGVTITAWDALVYVVTTFVR